MVEAVDFDDMVNRIATKFSEKNNSDVVVVSRTDVPLFFVKLLVDICDEIPLLGMLAHHVQAQLMVSVNAVIFYPATESGESADEFREKVSSAVLNTGERKIENVSVVGKDKFRMTIDGNEYGIYFLTYNSIMRDYLTEFEHQMTAKTKGDKYPYAALLDPRSDAFEKVKEELSYDLELGKFFQENFEEDESERILTLAFKEKASRDATVAILQDQEIDEVPPTISVH
jgi:ribosomal protein S6